MERVKTKKRVRFGILSVTFAICVWLISHWATAVMALPSPDDTPEEILRTEIIIDARSPIDGKPLSPAEYAQLQTQLQEVPPPQLTEKIRETLFLLRIRKAFFPFLSF
jgi:hypothetical protein